MYESIHKFIQGKTGSVTNMCQADIFEIIYFQEEIIIDPFAMPTWRKLAWSIFFFLMVAAADIGNIIGNFINTKMEII